MSFKLSALSTSLVCNISESSALTDAFSVNEINCTKGRVEHKTPDQPTSVTDACVVKESVEKSMGGW